MRPLLAVVLVTLPLATFADEAGIHVDHVWSRAAMAGYEGAVYLTITDKGSPDTLTGITTPFAAEAALHRSIDDHGVAKVPPVTSRPIESGKPVTLAPGGYHIMLMGLKQTLKQGDSGESWRHNAKHGPRQHGRHADARQREATLISRNRHAVMECAEWRRRIDAVRDLSYDPHWTLGHCDT